MEKDMEQYIEKLRRYYDSDNRLTQYPSKKPMRILALIQIALKISPERKYTENYTEKPLKAFEITGFSAVSLSFVLVVGLEPTQGCPRQILSLLRLPFRHTSK